MTSKLKYLAKIAIVSSSVLLQCEDKVEIRKYAEKTDWPTVEKILDDHPHWMPESYIYDFCTDKGITKNLLNGGLFPETYVITLNDEIIGFSNYRIGRNENPNDEGKFAEIMMFCMDKRYAASSHTNSLLQYTLSSIKEKYDPRNVYVYLEQNKVLTRIFKPQGFQTVGKPHSAQWFKLETNGQSNVTKEEFRQASLITLGIATVSAATYFTLARIAQEVGYCR